MINEHPKKGVDHFHSGPGPRLRIRANFFFGRNFPGVLGENLRGIHLKRLLIIESGFEKRENMRVISALSDFESEISKPTLVVVDYFATW